MTALRNAPAPRFFKTTLALGLGHGREHGVSLLLGFTAENGVSVEIVSARITSFINTHGVEVPFWLMSMIEGDETLAASLLAEAWTEHRAAA